MPWSFTSKPKRRAKRRIVADRVAVVHLRHHCRVRGLQLVTLLGGRGWNQCTSISSPRFLASDHWP